MAVEDKIKLFSIYGHVAYQVKGNEMCSNMVANILPTDTPSTRDGVKRSNTTC